MRLLALAALLSVASAQTVFVTQPINDTVWQTGQDVQIRWQSKDGSTLSDKNLNVDLMWGPSGALQRIQGLGCAPGSAGFLTYTVSDQLPSSKNYSVRVGSGSYSVIFAINNPKVNDTGKAPAIVQDIGCQQTSAPKSGAASTTAGVLAGASVFLAMWNL